MRKLKLDLEELHVDTFDPAAAGAGDGTVVGEQFATGAMLSCGGVCTHFSCFHTCNATCLTCFRTCGPLTLCQLTCQQTCQQTCNFSCFTCAGRTCPPHMCNPSAFEMC